MVRIEAQNKYVGGGREGEACFLDLHTKFNVFGQKTVVPIITHSWSVFK